MEEEVIEATAVKLSRGIQKLSQADEWLAKTRATVEQLQTQYAPIEVRDEASYKYGATTRTALRKDIAKIENERKELTRFLEDTLADFKGQTATLLEPLTTLEKQYQDAINTYKAEKSFERLDTMKANYIELAPALADIVPFERIWGLYSREKKWLNRSTLPSVCYRDLVDIINEIARNEQTILNLDLPNEDKAAAREEYFATLNFETAIKNAAERKERLRNIDSLDQMRAEASSEAEAVEETPKETQNVTQNGSEQPQKRVFEFWVTPTQTALLINFCKANGIHGTAKKVEG